MPNGLPTKTEVGVPGKSVSVNLTTYLTGLRMEKAGMLRPGQALMLAATLPNAKTPKKGKRK